MQGTKINFLCSYSTPGPLGPLEDLKSTNFPGLRPILHLGGGLTAPPTPCCLLTLFKLGCEYPLFELGGGGLILILRL